MHKAVKLVFRLCFFLVSVLWITEVVFVSYYWNTPVLFAFRSWQVRIALANLFAGLLASYFYSKYLPKRLRLLSLIFIAAATISGLLLYNSNLAFEKAVKRISVHSTIEPRPETTIEATVSATPTLTKHQKWGQRFMVGYVESTPIEDWIIDFALAGVFVTKRNVEGLTKEELSSQFARWQSLREEANLPPLLLAADQEGGMVERLSPPLEHMASLAEVIKQSSLSAQISTRDYAASQAAGLTSIGMNMNLAPVVDIDPGKVPSGDKYTQISHRAISDDPVKVASISAVYNQTMLSNGVLTTVKHFPGLGRASKDTHIRSATIDTKLEDLRNHDWIPFKDVNSPAMMLSHVTLSHADPDYPVSLSSHVVNNIIRDELDYQGVLITDDMTMGAIYDRKGGVRRASLEAINAGVDIILIAYDPDIFVLMFDEIISAAENGQVDTKTLDQSSQRIQKLQYLTTNH